MLCRKTTALTARLALADEGYHIAAEKGSVTFKLRVLDLCFPRGAQHRSRSSCIHRLLVLRASCIMPPPTRTLPDVRRRTTEER
jgi:hypothetical protein